MNSINFAAFGANPNQRSDPTLPFVDYFRQKRIFLNNCKLVAAVINENISDADIKIINYIYKQSKRNQNDNDAHMKNNFSIYIFMESQVNRNIAWLTAPNQLQDRQEILDL